MSCGKLVTATSCKGMGSKISIASVRFHTRLSSWYLHVLFVGGAIDRRVTGLACLACVIPYKPLLTMLIYHMFFVISLWFHVMWSVQDLVHRSERQEI